MFCYNCGQPVEEDSRFCTACGTPVRHTKEHTSADVEFTPVTMPDAQSKQPENTTEVKTELSIPLYTYQLTPELISMLPPAALERIRGKGFVENFKHVMKKWTFTGRASRGEYFKFIAAQQMIIFFIALFSSMLPLDSPNSTLQMTSFMSLTLAACIVLIIPSICLSVRRMHDIGKSGWWIWIIMFPAIGPLWALYLTLKEGPELQNAYGEKNNFYSLDAVNAGKIGHRASPSKGVIIAVYILSLFLSQISVHMPHVPAPFLQNSPFVNPHILDDSGVKPSFL